MIPQATRDRLVRLAHEVQGAELPVQFPPAPITPDFVYAHYLWASLYRLRNAAAYLETIRSLPALAVAPDLGERVADTRFPHD